MKWPKMGGVSAALRGALRGAVAMKRAAAKVFLISHNVFHQLVLESQLPHKTVDFLFTTTN